MTEWSRHQSGFVPASPSFNSFSLRIGVVGEYCKITGGLLWKGRTPSGNKKNVVEEFSDLRCLMNTLIANWSTSCELVFSTCSVHLMYSDAIYIVDPHHPIQANY